LTQLPSFTFIKYKSCLYCWNRNLYPLLCRQIVGCMMKVGRVDETTKIFMEGLDAGAFHSFRSKENFIRSLTRFPKFLKAIVSCAASAYSGV